MGMGPCCCCSSRIGALAISAVEIAGSIALTALLATGHVALDKDNAGVTIIQYVLYLCQFVLGIVLIVGVAMSSLKFLRIWFGVRCVVLAVFIISFTVLVCTNQVTVSSILIDVMVIAMTLWFILVVYDVLRQMGRQEAESLEERYPSNQE